jgi:hypothetical protein
MPIDSLDISREQHFVYATLNHVARMLDGVRDGKVGYTTAVVDMHCNAAENALESVLASVRKARAEARLITYQRERSNAVYDLSQRLPSPRPSAGLPVVGSFAAE